jgi:adenylate cyclase
LPPVPFEEESMLCYAAEQGLIMSLAYLRKQDDLAYLERRGTIPDTKIVCPVRVGNRIEKLLVICNYAGNVFSGEDDLETVQMVSTILGLVLQNTKVISEQKSEIAHHRQELLRLRNLFTSMVAPEVIDFIEKNPGGIVLGGLRQHVAILFCDIRGFTELASRITPEKTIDLLNKFFTAVTNIIIENKGTLDKFMGDAAMALFGTPVPIDDPIGAAVKTAIEIQKVLEEKMPSWKSLGFPTYGVGIGINYQEVIVGNVGSERLSNFTAIGDGVNIASRLCSIAQKGEILISETCFEHLSDLKERMEKRTGITIKGKSEPITVYSLFEDHSKLARTSLCPKCQSALPADVKFCGTCGYQQF